MARREYEHPIGILGAGMGGMMHAMEFIKEGRDDFIMFERFEGFGGTTWKDVANETTKLQTEKGTYIIEYLNPEIVAEDGMKTWPPRDEIVEMCQNVAEKHGLDEKAKFSADVKKVERKGDTLNGGHYQVEFTNEDDKTELVKVSAFIACPGVFYNPIDLKLEGKEQFDGYITHGSYDSINYDKLKDAKVCILGHGGFTIENVRTCVEKGATKISVLCRHRHLAGPKMVSWMVSGAAIPLPGKIVVDAMQIMYNLTGVDVWKHPVVSTNADKTSTILTQSTTFGVTDIYFLAIHYGVAEIIVGEIEKLSKRKVHINTGQELDCDVIMKCLGSTGDPNFDDMMCMEELAGWWMNGDPLLPVVAPAKGVQAKNFAGFSLAPGYASQLLCNTYFIDYPEKFAGVKEWLPKTKRDPTYSYNYIYKGASVLATMVILQGQFPDLAEKVGAADYIKSKKHLETHPLEKHLDQCMAEWEMYIKMMKDHGQIPQDAPHVEYPYTKENVQALNDEAMAAVRKEYEARMEKMKKKAGYAAK